jgi:hypothetical protein
MPSLHVGWAIWCGVLIAMYAQRRWVKVLGIAYPIVTTVVVMATGNHYLLDAIAGALTMGVGALLSAAVSRRTTPMPLAPARQSLDQVVAGRSMTAVRAAAAASSATAGEAKRRQFPASQLAADGDETINARLCSPRR